MNNRRHKREAKMELRSEGGVSIRSETFWCKKNINTRGKRASFSTKKNTFSIIKKLQIPLEEEILETDSALNCGKEPASFPQVWICSRELYLKIGKNDTKGVGAKPRCRNHSQLSLLHSTSAQPPRAAPRHTTSSPPLPGDISISSQTRGTD